MRIVVALGGNALLKRGEALTAENQRANVRIAAEALSKIASDHQLVISHGNGPQVGLLALQSTIHNKENPYPLDVLGAETEGMIGYMIEQELGNLVPFEIPFATLLTMVEVDPDDPAFDHPTKPIGPVYTKSEIEQLAKERDWSFAPDGKGWRRVVPSPEPKRIFEIRPIRWLLEKGVIVICAGGGGIPTVYDNNRKLHGAEVVVDKDKASTLLAKELNADMLVIATDVDGVYRFWGTDKEEKISNVTPERLMNMDFATGSMKPKVEAACDFVNSTGNKAVIGALTDIDKIIKGIAGTIVSSKI